MGSHTEKCDRKQRKAVLTSKRSIFFVRNRGFHAIIDISVINACQRHTAVLYVDQNNEIFIAEKIQCLDFEKLSFLHLLTCFLLIHLPFFCVSSLNFPELNSQ